jgi:hypothetical protein
MNAAAQYGITPLLETAGARIRGRNRADCPECGRPRAVSFNESAFCCHGIDCNFRGGIGTLRERLGLRREWLPKPEYIRQCRNRERARDAAERLYAAAKARRFELYDKLQSLAQIEIGVHKAGLTNPAWNGLALVYQQRPRLLAELTILENASAPDLVRFLIADETTRQVVIDRVMLAGGMRNAVGEFVGFSL